MPRLTLAPNIPADNRLAIAFKATYETKQVLMELAQLLAEVNGDTEPLTISATIRTCIHFTYARRKTIMMRRLRENQRNEEQCRNNQNSTNNSPNNTTQTTP